MGHNPNPHLSHWNLIDTFLEILVHYVLPDSFHVTHQIGMSPKFIRLETLLIK